MNQFYYQLPDGRVWGLLEAAWLTEIPNGASLIMALDMAHLVSCVLFYKGEFGALIKEVDFETVWRPQFEKGIQARLDNFAGTKGYLDGEGKPAIISAISYTSSTDAGYKSDADYCNQMRDNIWRAAFALEADISAGIKPQTTIEEALTQLPALAWPGA